MFSPLCLLTILDFPGMLHHGSGSWLPPLDALDTPKDIETVCAPKASIFDQTDYNRIPNVVNQLAPPFSVGAAHNSGQKAYP